jgi:hypothetical protein
LSFGRAQRAFDSQSCNLSQTSSAQILPAGIPNGMAFRESVAVLEMGPLMTFPIRGDFLGLPVACRKLLSGQDALMRQTEVGFGAADETQGRPSFAR